MTVDFIIVGQGLAGTCFAFELIRRGKTFIIIDKHVPNSSSQIALGVYNPVILKWFTKPWHVDKQLNLFYDFYNDFSNFLNINVYYDCGIYKFLNSVGDQNTWLSKSKKDNLYLSSKLYDLGNVNLNNPKYYGRVKNSGRLDVKTLLKHFRNYCEKKKILYDECINFNDISINKSYIEYQNIRSKKIIFCEGYSVINNPYFDNRIFQPTKGEILTIFCKNLNFDYIIHAGLLIVPLEENVYRIGSTYNWNYKNQKPTKYTKRLLLDKLNRVISTSYKVVDHQAGLRPSTTDRRPIIGSHKKYHNMFILNGLGTRGVLLAPYLSSILARHIYSNEIIPFDSSIARI